MKSNIITINPLENKLGIIAHINFTGVMGISIKYAFSHQTRRQLNKSQAQAIPLGNIKVDLIEDEMKLVNLSVLDNNNQLNYKAFAFALHKLSKYSQQLCHTPFIPFGIGCGLLGGNWELISTLINKYCPNALVCKLPKYQSHKVSPVTNYNSFIPKPNVIYLPTSISEAKQIA